MKYDTEKLREDMEEESFSAFYVGGFGGAMSEAAEIENASSDELIGMAGRHGFSLSGYEDDDDDEDEDDDEDW